MVTSKSGTPSCPRLQAVAIALSLLAFVAGRDGARADSSCAFAAQGEGHVSAVIDARTLRLDDGRDIRLAGIEPGDEDATITALATLVRDKDVELRGNSDAPDRYGRQNAFVFAPAALERSVQEQLLAQGAAVSSGTTDDRPCAAALAASEAEARQAKRGVWVDRGAIKNAERSGDILAKLGQFAVAEGTVLSARQAGATHYLNFGRRWTQDFAVTISRRAMATFDAAGMNVATLAGKRIRVRGFVERRGGPRIDAVRVGQIELIGE